MKADAAEGPVRDHRPLCLNHDDYLRCAAVPKEKNANYRSLPGLVTNRTDKALGASKPACSPQMSCAMDSLACMHYENLLNMPQLKV